MIDNILYSFSILNEYLHNNGDYYWIFLFGGGVWIIADGLGIALRIISETGRNAMEFIRRKNV